MAKQASHHRSMSINTGAAASSRYGSALQTTSPAQKALSMNYPMLILRVSQRLAPETVKKVIGTGRIDTKFNLHGLHYDQVTGLLCGA